MDDDDFDEWVDAEELEEVEPPQSACDDCDDPLEGDDWYVESDGSIVCGRCSWLLSQSGSD